MMHNPV